MASEADHELGLKVVYSPSYVESCSAYNYSLDPTSHTKTRLWVENILTRATVESLQKSS